MILLEQIVGVAERQPVVGVDVEAPEQIFLPGRQRLGADGADVGERHQAEHLEVLFGADQLGELRDDLRIFRVAAERRLRHLRGAGGSGTPRVCALVGRQLQPVEHALREAQALLRVVGFPPLADVVEQERQREQLRRVHLVAGSSRSGSG